ncbi:MAG: MBL fold metallo-hydrolase [Clostridia bacterium]|nr:MBL fold metallo-hydrolase [Clostridia bacterium]
MEFRKFLSLILVALFSFIPCACSEEPEEILEVHFLSVGTNDGILLRAGDECAFIDSGNYPQGEMCVAYMKEQGVTNLKYYIGTHAHLDHVGGAPAIVGAIPTESVIYTYQKTLDAIYVMRKNETEIRALDALERCPIAYGDVFTLGGATLTCVGPEMYVPKSSFQDQTENNNSLLLHIRFGDITFFLTGDTPSWKVLQMEKNHPEVLKSTVIKAPHHRGGFDKSIYKMIDAEYIVFSTADTWLPLEDQMKMARESSQNVLITADNRNGHIVFTTDGKTISVQTQFDYDYGSK